MSGKFTPLRITASEHSLIFIKTAGTYAGFYHANEFIRKAYVSKFTYTALRTHFLRYDNIHLVYGSRKKLRKRITLNLWVIK